eukprot:GFUD01006878.1.p1 GENE.GFUD01006878.1~~GFUD01006878.1.p1  ORF type:complete len:277 (-),score=69.63 GFUD01006878.1:111-941(-)
MEGPEQEGKVVGPVKNTRQRRSNQECQIDAPSHPVHVSPQLPLLRGKQFELLSPGELKDTLSYCIYCNKKFCNPSSRGSHMLSQHHEEHNRNVIDNDIDVMNALDEGMNINMTSMQMDAYIMAILERKKVQSGSPLDRLQHDVVFNGKKISPILFSLLLSKVQSKDDEFSQVMKILSKSVTTLEMFPANLIREHFQSERFFQQFLQVCRFIDELRKEHPEQVQERKLKNRMICIFRSKLLKFLDKQFGRNWAQNLIMKAEAQKARGLPLEDGVDGH